jgi:hypothetical protein
MGAPLAGSILEGEQLFSDLLDLDFEILDLDSDLIHSSSNPVGFIATSVAHKIAHGVASQIRQTARSGCQAELPQCGQLIL